MASGSNGNCYYVGNEEEAILIDAGLSFKQLLGRMVSKGIDPRKVKALFVTHEHGDHIRGARVLSKRLDVPVYMTTGTFRGAFKTWKPLSFTAIEAMECIQIGDFTVWPVSKQHDASDPVSFRIDYQGISIGVFTDIGTPCDRVRHHLRQCHALFLETNYDHDLLMNGPYPYYLKSRISSDVGHLSNLQAYDLLSACAHPDLQCVFLSHLSAENNTPETAIAQFSPLMAKYRIELTDRHGPSDRVRIG